MPLLQAIIEYFKSKDLVEGEGIDAYRDFSPNSPDDVVIVYEYQGDPRAAFELMVNRSVQVSVRAKVAENARKKIAALYKSLISEEETLVVKFTSSRWGQVHLRDQPRIVHRDDSGRTVYAFNCGISTNID